MKFESDFNALIEEIVGELRRARAKFPTWPDDPIHAAAIVAEECGELQKAVLQCVYEPQRCGLDDVKGEAIQTAAMAIRFLTSMDRYNMQASSHHRQDEPRHPNIAETHNHCFTLFANHRNCERCCICLPTNLGRESTACGVQNHAICCGIVRSPHPASYWYSLTEDERHVQAERQARSIAAMVERADKDPRIESPVMIPLACQIDSAEASAIVMAIARIFPDRVIAWCCGNAEERRDSCDHFVSSIQVELER